MTCALLFRKAKLHLVAMLRANETGSVHPLPCLTSPRLPKLPDHPITPTVVVILDGRPDRRTDRRQGLRFRPHTTVPRLAGHCRNHSPAGQPADPDLVRPAAIPVAPPGGELLLRPQAVQGRGDPLQQAGRQLLRDGEPGLLDHRDQVHTKDCESPCLQAKRQVPGVQHSVALATSPSGMIYDRS